MSEEVLYEEDERSSFLALQTQTLGKKRNECMDNHRHARVIRARMHSESGCISISTPDCSYRVRIIVNTVVLHSTLTTPVCGNRAGYH